MKSVTDLIINFDVEQAVATRPMVFHGEPMANTVRWFTPPMNWLQTTPTRWYHPEAQTVIVYHDQKFLYFSFREITVHQLSDADTELTTLTTNQEMKMDDQKENNQDKNTSVNTLRNKVIERLTAMVVDPDDNNAGIALEAVRELQVLGALDK